LIENLIAVPLPGFGSGRVTCANRAEFPLDSLEKAKNVVLHDNGIQRVKGYKKIGNIGFAIDRLLPYQRQTDRKQFIIATGGGNIAVLDQNVTLITSLTAAETTDAATLIEGLHSAYLFNDNNAYTLYDPGTGSIVKRKAGQLAPAFTPTLIQGVGTLNLTYGRRYVVCEVVYWTDAQGVQRYHIGPPSAFSAHTGPVVNGSVQVNLGAAANPATTHFWIFSTEDSEIDTSASYAFAAEVTVATPSWGDTNLDSALDVTRPAPFDNFAPPASKIVVEYENRLAILKDDEVQFTGFEEIFLGVPQETAPAALSFKVPSGTKVFTGAINYQQSLLFGNDDWWYQLRGADAASFAKRDRIFGPGPAGYKLAIESLGHLLWVSRDMNLRGWDGTNLPAVISPMLTEPGYDQDTLSMSDMHKDWLNDAELLQFEGKDYAFVVLAVNTTGSKTKNWIQLWDISEFVKGKGDSAVETDMIPAHPITTMMTFRLNGDNVVYFGASDGSIYQWPSGTTFDDQNIIAIAESPPSLMKFLGQKEMKFADLYTNRDDAVNQFKFFALGQDAVSKNAVALQLLEPMGDGVADGSQARFDMKTEKTAMAKFLKWRIEFPDDDQSAVIHAIIIAHIRRPGIIR
jgi:hypothetical protein